MSEICGLIGGLDCPTCTDLKAKAGLVKNLYIGRLSDLDSEAPFDYDEDGRITAVNLQYEKYLYKFCAKDKTANYTQPKASGDNGVPLRQPVVKGLFQQQGQIAKNVWDALEVVEDLFVIVETNYSTFEAFFTESGGKITVSDKPSGTQYTDANSFNITFSQDVAGETKYAPDVLDTDYQTTKELLESYLQ